MIKKKDVLIFLARLAEVYPIGHIKKAPGTFASFISLFIGYYLITLLGILKFIIFIFIFSIIGLIISEIHVKVFKQKDPKEVVIDEFAGQFIALLAITNSNDKNDVLLSIMLSFLLFRFFDITKLGPIKKFEQLPGGIGIMADDIVAGICAFLVQCAIMTAFDQQLLIKVY